MRQRLCLAHALVHDPQVLLLDEPASGLNPRARVEMRELLRELRAMGKTILLSSHIFTELAELCGYDRNSRAGKFGGEWSFERNPPASRRAPTYPARASLKFQPGGKCLDGTSWNQANLPQGKFRTPNNGTSHQIDIEFAGDSTATADLLEALVKAEVRLISFSERTTDLEEAFLRLTKGRLPDASHDPLGSQPIIVKALRSRMCGGRAFATFTGALILLAACGYAIYRIALVSLGYTTAH